MFSYLEPFFVYCLAQLQNSVFKSMTMISIIGVMILSYLLWIPNGPAIHKFTRKHGRWKPRQFYPSTFLILSLTSIPLASAFLMSRTSQHLSFVRHWKWSFLDPPDPTFQDILDDIGPPIPSFVEPHFADEWDEYLLHQALSRAVHGDIPHDDCTEPRNQGEDCKFQGEISVSTETSTFTSISDVFDDLIYSTSVVRITSYPEDMSFELEEALLDLPKYQSYYSPKACQNQSLDIHHLIRPSSASMFSGTPTEKDTFSVLMDTGCTVATTGFVEDFCGQLAYGNFGHIKTADGASPIQGFGMIHWRTTNLEGNSVIIKVPGYFVPNVDMRLMSPQDYVRYHDLSTPGEMNYYGNGESMMMNVLRTDSSGFPIRDTKFSPSQTTINAWIDARSRLPFFTADHPTTIKPPEFEKSKTCHHSAHAHVSQNVYDPRNTNLSHAQKLLKLDHDRLGHIGFKKLQTMYLDREKHLGFDGSSTSRPPLLVAQDRAQFRCTRPVCATCLVAKQRRRPNDSKHTTEDPEAKDSIRAEDLNPGDLLSVDQYASPVRGRLPSSRGQERLAQRYCGGTLFYDHASGKIFVRHQVSLGGYETVNSKHSVEREALEHGVTIKKYRSDNGIFKDYEFTEALIDDGQWLS